MHVKFTIPQMMLICLALTLIIEVLFAFIIGMRKGKDYINVILVNVLTNPLVVSLSIAIQFFAYRYYYVGLFGLEILAVLVEGYIYKKYLHYNHLNPYIVSLMLNIASYGLGQLLNYLIYL